MWKRKSNDGYMYYTFTDLKRKKHTLSCLEEGIIIDDFIISEKTACDLMAKLANFIDYKRSLSRSKNG